MIFTNSPADELKLKFASPYGKPRLFSGYAGWLAFVIMIQTLASPLSAAQPDVQSVNDWERAVSRIFDERKITVADLHALGINELKPLGKEEFYEWEVRLPPIGAVLLSPGSRLFDLPREPTIVALRMRLKSGKAEIRYLAMIYLRAFDDKKSLPFFVRLLESDPATDVRIRVARELGDAKFEPALNALCKAFDESESRTILGQTMATSLQKFGPRAVETLLKPLPKMKVEQQKIKRIRLVESLGDNGHLDVLFPVATSPTKSDLERSAAIIVLGKYNYKKIAPDLIKILAEPRIRNRSDLCLAVKDALEAFGESAVQVMVKTLAETPDGHFRCNIIWALMRGGAEAAIPELTRRLQDVDSGVRSHAITALGQVEGKPAAKKLLPLLDDGTVKSGALLALEKLANQSFNNDIEACKKWWQDAAQSAI